MNNMKIVLIAVALIASYLPGGLCKKKNRIIHGREATIDEFPFQVSIESRGAHSCGGSILSDIIVLTAAHCTAHLEPTPDGNGVDPFELRVHVGTSYANSPIEGSVHNISAFRRHPAHGSYPVTADLAVLLLKEPIQLNPNIMAIRLAERTPVPGEIAWVTGYGLTEIQPIDPLVRQEKYYGDEPPPPRELRAVRLPIIGMEECQQKLHALGGTVTKGMICAGHQKGHRDSCRGDSGGPLVIGNKLTGIVAWGLGCGQEGLPGVYTDVSYYRSWIFDTANELAYLHQAMQKQIAYSPFRKF